MRLPLLVVYFFVSSPTPPPAAVSLALRVGQTETVPGAVVLLPWSW